MAVPEEIRKVPRPKNTIVIASKNSYLVIERTGCRYVNGKRYPINGKTIGHIIDGKYVPNSTKAELHSVDDMDLRDYADAAFFDMLGQDLLTDLNAVFAPADALKIYLAAVLRSLEPELTDRSMKDAYDSSYLSVRYPRVGLSRNTVGTLLEDLGKHYSYIHKFMEERVNRLCPSGTVFVDGMLKSNNSKINTFSEMSRKGRLKNSRDINIIYAMQAEVKEPVCCKIYPGNVLDNRAFKEFIEENHIKEPANKKSSIKSENYWT